jgi:hypothetical protein
MPDAMFPALFAENMLPRTEAWRQTLQAADGAE